MSRLKVINCILIDCISFTTSAVLLSVLTAVSEEWGPSIHAISILELFFCTTLISVLSYFTSRIRVDSSIFSSALILINVGAVILGVGGGIFKWFPWTWVYILEVTVILVIVYIITLIAMLWQNKKLSDEINRKIKEGENGPYNRN